MDTARSPMRDGVLVAVPCALLVVLAIMTAYAGDSGFLPLLNDAIGLALALVAAGYAGRATRATEGPVRRAWGALTAAILVSALGDTLWLLSGVGAGTPPVPAPTELMYLTFTGLVAFGLAQLLSTGTRVWRSQLVLDGLTVALCLFLLVWIFGFNRVFDSFRHDHAQRTLALVFPLLDVLVLSIGVLAVVRSRRRKPGSLAVVTVAFALITVADVTLSMSIVEIGYQADHVIDMLRATAMALFAIAAVQARQPRPLPERPSPVPPASSVWLPYLPLLLAGVLGPPVVMRGFESVLVPMIVCVVCARQILTARENRQLLSAAADRALRDPLTGLANRTLFNERLDHAMLLRTRDDRPITVISIDLDDFKLVNDSLGHPVADGLLVDAGHRFRECIRAGDTVARLGGDEFAVLLEGGEEDHQLVARSLVEAFALPFHVDGQEVFLRPSVGVATATDGEPELTAKTLISRADIAMYAAKRSRSCEVRTYGADLVAAQHDRTLFKRGPRKSSGGGAERIRLLGELRHAVDHGAIDVVYQPKVNLASGEFAGVEALLRWPHPRLGVLLPGAFLSLVRQHGLIHPVSDLVVTKVLDDAVSWRADGVDIPVAVNLFAPMLRDGRLPARLCHQLDSRGLVHGALTVEITEDIVLTEVGTVTSVLRDLREHDVRVSIDDFGSGYSALSYLRDLLIDEVKLDRRFIAPVTADPRAAAVVSAIIELTHVLGITVVAEGVEDAGTADWLARNGCDIGQGYHFSAPVQAGQVPAVVSGLDISDSSR